VRLTCIKSEQCSTVILRIHSADRCDMTLSDVALTDGSKQELFCASSLQIHRCY